LPHSAVSARTWQWAGYTFRPRGTGLPPSTSPQRNHLQVLHHPAQWREFKCSRKAITTTGSTHANHVCRYLDGWSGHCLSNGGGVCDGEVRGSRSLQVPESENLKRLDPPGPRIASSSKSDRRQALPLPPFLIPLPPSTPASMQHARAHPCIPCSSALGPTRPGHRDLQRVLSWPGRGQSDGSCQERTQAPEMDRYPPLSRSVISGFTAERAGRGATCGTGSGFCVEIVQLDAGRPSRHGDGGVGVADALVASPWRWAIETSMSFDRVSPSQSGHGCPAERLGFPSGSKGPPALFWF